MASTKKEIVLADWCVTAPAPVLWYCSIGVPLGEHVPLCHEYFDFAERRNLEDLVGEVDEEGNWQWLGGGSPTDDARNTILNLEAFSAPKLRNQIIEDYYSEGDGLPGDWLPTS